MGLSRNRKQDDNTVSIQRTFSSPFSLQRCDLTPGMMLSVQGLHALAGHMGVDLGRAEIAVAQ